MEKVKLDKSELWARIQKNCRYHNTDDNQKERFAEVRACIEFASKRLYQLCPEGRELSLALNKLEEAMFWANAGIAREE